MTTIKIYPTSDEDISVAQQYPDSGSHYDKVDEVSADDATTYIKEAKIGEYATTADDYFGLTDTSVLGDINSVKIYIRGIVQLGYFAPGIKTHSTVYWGDNSTMPETYTTYSDTWTTNPYTGESWTWEEVNALQAIARLHAFAGVGAKWAIVTQVYIEIDYDAVVEPTVTTQAVSDILSTTATGNGNITVTAFVNCTKRGVCYNTTGSPTIADDYVEEEGDFGTGAFTSSITGLSPGVKYYVKAYAYNEAGYGYGNEVNFTTDKVAPTVTCQDASDLLTTSVTANGTITALGGENSTVRGFKYGLTEDDTWSASDSGDYGLGAYTKGLTSLVANTTYHIKAYATNSMGTSYSAWTTFQTAAVGTVPVGTKISICSDYTGYTYKQHESLTEETYTSYFVLTTDLGKGLHINKRIEEIYSYFMDKSSGTAKVYIKRDNETTWQYCGEISMEGDSDINIKHLPSDNVASTGEVDYLGKHFLIKYVFENDFEFIGLITEAIPGDKM